MTTRQLIEERRTIKDEALHEFAADVGDCDPRRGQRRRHAIRCRG